MDSAGGTSANPPPVPRRPAAVAGAGLLAMAVLAALTLLGVLAPVTGADSPQAFASAVQDGGTAVRVGLLGLLVVVLLDVVVAWALRDVLAPAAPALARLAGWTRLAYAAAFLAAAGSLVRAVDLAADDPAGGLAAAGTFTSTWDTALLLFGAHLMVVALALVVGRQAPLWVAALVGVAGVGYLVDAVVTVLDLPLRIGTVTFVGELVLMAWLLLRAGRRS